MGTGSDNPDTIPYKYVLLISFVFMIARVLDKIYEGEDVWGKDEEWILRLNQ